MTDSIKFGPEWLRNMSQGISKPQLAEHRYGREEMLALFDISSCNLPPESLKELSMVYSEKPQTPLSLQQMSEEETRLWNRGINSDTIVRASVRTTTGGRGTANIEVRGGSTSARGRGGRGGYYYSTTRPGYEEGPEGGGSPMNRGPHRPFERLNSNERNINRNGEYTNDWRGRDESNNWWRKNRGGAHQGQSEESNGRWGRTRSDSYNNDRWPAGRPTSRYDEDEGWDRGESRWSNNNSTTHERRKLDWGETLPEWAVDNPGEKGGSFDSSGAFHDNHYDEHHYNNMRDEQSREKEQEYEEDNDDPSVNNLESSNMLPTKDKQLNGQEKEEVVSSSISTSPSQNEEVTSSPERFKSMRQQHQQHNVCAQTTNKEPFIQNEQVMVNHSEPVRIQQVPDIPVIHSKSSPAIPIMSDCQPNKMENIKNMREMSGMGIHSDNSNINHIHRSTSLNANANHRIDTLDAEAESMVSRLTSDNFKIGPSSHTPLAPLTNNKWYYRDPQGEVQGPFLTTEMAEWYSLGYFHDNLLMVKRACDEHFYSLGDLVRLKGNVPFSDSPFTEQDVKISARIGVQPPPPTHNPFTMNESLVLQQQQQQQHYQYRQLFLKQREMAIQSAVHQLSQSERWNTLSPIEQQQLIMHHIRNVEANTTIPPIFTAPIIPQPQPQQTIHPMNPPANNNLMVMLSHMQQQQQQHFNHQIDPKHNIHSVPPSQPMAQQMDPLHSLVQSMGSLKTSTPPPVNASHHHQNSNVIRPNNAQPENNPISDLLRQLGAPQDKPLKVAETSVWGVDFTGPDSKPKMNGPVGISGWQTGPPVESSQQTPGVLWGSGEFTKIIGADHQAIEEAIKEEARRSEEARKLEIIKQNQQLRKREEENSKMQKELKKKQELEKAKLEEEKKKEEARKNKEREKKIKEDAEKKKLEKKKLEDEQAKKREHDKKLKEEKEKRLLEEKKKEEEKRLLEEEKKRKADLKKKEDHKKKEEQKKKEDLKRKEETKKQDQKKKDEDQKKKQDNSKPSAVPIVTEPHKKKKKEPQLVSHNGVESASAPWAATDQKKQVQVKSMAEIQAEEQKREQMIKQKERERTEREISMVAIEQAKQDKARSAVKMQSWSTVIAKNVPQPVPQANNSVWGSTNQTNTDKQQTQKSNKSPAVAVNKTSVKTAVKTVNPTVQQTNAMKKAIETRGENNNCNDEFSQWCCKHLATINKNTIDIPTFVTFLKDVESEFEVKDYIQNYLGDNKEVREFIKQFFDKRLKIQNKQRSSDFVEMKSKNKKRNKMVPLDNKVLGFNVVASERINVGELDLGE